MPKAIIFDMDGTLVDSVDLHAESWAVTFRQFGHDIPEHKVRFQIGKGGDQILPHLLGQAEADARGKEMESWRGDLFKLYYMPRVRPFPQVVALLHHIRARGQRIALASSAKAEELQVYKKIAGITDLVDAETTSDDAERSKPHPDIFSAVLKKLHLRAEDVVVVGDSHYDIEAAGKLGIDAVGLLCGGFPEGVLREAGAVAIYRDPADLLTEYRRSPLA
jgi:HAD superfamily hydrolase (TIGR01509 family)